MSSIFYFLIGCGLVDWSSKVDYYKVTNRFGLDASLDAAEGKPLRVVGSASEFIN